MIKDITGQRFGKLVVVKKTDERRSGHVMWECKCSCGKTSLARTCSLTSGSVNSCGCSRAQGVGLVGQKFGRLTAIEPTDKRQGSNVVWKCKCDCGNTKFARAGSLTTGNTKSCGCLKAKRKRY